jgi:hypothetical protein
MRGLYHRPYRTFNGGGCWTRSGSMLMRTLFRLRFRVSAIEEKGYDLFEWFFADVNGAMDPIGRLNPIHFTRGDLPGMRFAPIAKLYLQQITAQHDGDAMKGVVMPGRGFSRS